MLNKVLNVVLFQIGWLICVLGAARGYPWLGPLLALPIIGVHARQSPDPAMALRMVLFAGCLGAIIDSGLGYFGLLLFQETVIASWFCPPWLIVLWAIFATTLRSSLVWLRDRPRLAALLGGMFGPISYYAGQELGALRFGDPATRTALILSALWGLLLPLLLRFGHAGEKT